MTNYDPTSALLIFAVFTGILFLFFRPKTGWYWIITDNLRTSEKIIIEDILKQLYHNEISGNEQTVNALTNGLKFKNSLIIEVIEKMAMNDLVAIEGDVVKLKSKGRNYALRIVRVHRLWEKYLAEKTGFDKKEWHDRAHHNCRGKCRDNDNDQDQQRVTLFAAVQKSPCLFPMTHREFSHDKFNFAAKEFPFRNLSRNLPCPDCSHNEVATMVVVKRMPQTRL